MVVVEVDVVVDFGDLFAPSATVEAGSVKATLNAMIAVAIPRWSGFFTLDPLLVTINRLLTKTVKSLCVGPMLPVKTGTEIYQ